MNGSVQLERHWAYRVAAIWLVMAGYQVLQGAHTLAVLGLGFGCATATVGWIRAEWWSRVLILMQVIGLASVAAVGGVTSASWLLLLAVLVGGWLDGPWLAPWWAALGVLCLPAFGGLSWGDWIPMVVAMVLGTGIGGRAHQRQVEAERVSAGHAEFLKEKNLELEASSRALEEALRLRSAFMANMSHEIRTPLNGVLAMARLLLDTRLNEGQEEMAQTIDRSGRSLLALLNDVLDWSKIESGHLELEMVRYNPRAVVQEVLELFAGAAQEANIDLAGVFDPSMPIRALGDAARLRQVLANLVGNAVKFTKTGGVVVMARADEERLYFKVQDTGIGISPSRRESLFRPFVQADASTSRRFGGTGLGLAVSRRLVEVMGGEISARSEEGVGSEFQFAVLWEVTTDDSSALTRVTRLRRRRILVVEPRSFTAESVRSALAEMGAEVDVVSAFEEVAPRLETTRYHGVVVSALAGDPTEMAARLTAMDAPPRVLLAQLAGPSTHGRATDLGYGGVAFSPVRGRDLCVVVDAAIHGERSMERTAWSFFENSLAERVPLDVLVAEDNPTNQRVIELVLQRLGYAPDFAANGLEAVSAVRRRRYDLVLMDVLMPIMDGLEATEVVLREQGDDAPCVVGLTASVSADARRSCLKAGMREVLAKPLEIESLVSMLESVGSVGQPRALPAPARDHRATAALEMLLQLCDGSEAKRRDLVAAFLVNADELLDEMRRSLDDGQVETLERAAHSMKGSSPMYGAPTLGKAASELEAHVRKHGLDGAARFVSAVESELEEARSFLEASV